MYWGTGGHHMCKWIYLHSRTSLELWILRMPLHPEDSLWLIRHGFSKFPLLFGLASGGERLPFEEDSMDGSAVCLCSYPIL